MAARWLQRLASRTQIASAPDMLQAPCSVLPVLLPAGTPVAGFAEHALGLGAQFRRYYHPSLSQGFRGAPPARPTPVADELADRMLCLPVYADAADQEIEELIGIFEQTCQAFGLW